jgi:hypothetical protein
MTPRRDPVKEHTTIASHLAAEGTRPGYRDWLIIMGAFVLALTVLVGAAERSGVDALSADTWGRWDSGHYLSIADDGYDLHRCDPTREGETTYTRDDWCGNAHWFPGYPFALRAIGTTGIPLDVAGVLVARIAHLGALAAIWLLFLRRMPRAPALLAMALAAVFPGFVYQAAVFPISVTTLSLACSLALLVRRRWLAAGLVGAVAVLAYPTGILMVGVGGLVVLLALGLRSWRSWVVPAVAFCSPLLAAYGVVLAVFQFDTGRWDAYFLTDQHYGLESVFFVEAIWRQLDVFVDPGGLSRAVAGQTLLVAAFIVCAIVFTLYRSRWRLTDDVDRVLVIFALVFWIFPLSLGEGLSLYRAEALLVPAAVLSTRLPRALQVVFVVLALALGFFMAQLFFDNYLQ